MTFPAKNLFRTVCLIPLALFLLGGCSSAPDEEFVPVTVNGNLKMAVGPVPVGTIHFRAYHLDSLQGELRHPLAEIGDFESDSPDFSLSFDYPVHKGTGLALHAWVDADGDGVFCTPTVRTDPSGMIWMEDVPEGTINATIVLTDNCRAANWFYPPKP